MSNKLTSFLLGAVAAVLLAVPANAIQKESFARKAQAGVMHAQRAKVTKQHSVRDVAMKNAEKSTLRLTSVEKMMADRAAEAAWAKGQAPWTPKRKAQLHEMTMGKQPIGKLRSTRVVWDVTRTAAPSAAKAPRKNIDQVVVTKDAHGIITDVSGVESQFYARSGQGMYVSGNSLYLGAQSGHVELIFDNANSKVYIKDPISYSTENSWVEGAVAGNTITVAAGQPLSYSSIYYATLSLFWGNYDENSDDGWNKVAGDITFTIDEEAKTISLVGSSEDLYIGIFWDDDNSFTGYGDYETVWTLDEDYEPVSTDPVVAPADLQTETWYSTIVNLSDKVFTGTATVGFDGNDVYVKGIFSEFPNSWIKGTVNGSTVTFSNFQYLGLYYDTYDIWAIGVTNDEAGAFSDYTFVYDEAAGTLKLNPAFFLVQNAAEDHLYYLDVFTSVVLSKEAPETPEEPDIVTGPNVDVLPYINDFETEDKQADFGVYDANGGSSWAPYNASGNTVFAYIYDEIQSGNDWLVSPGIKLEAGKQYTVSIDVWAALSSYPEKFEMFMAAEPKASSLVAGTTIFSPTTVNWATAQTQQAENITVSETGYYHFGIHAISEADMFRLYVDNFIVEEGAASTAPAAVANFTVTPLDEVLGATIAFTAPTTTIGGDALADGDITRIDVLRDGIVIKSFESPAPGAELSFVDEASDLTIGNHTYQVFAYGADGAGGKSDEITVFLSAVVDVPQSYDLSKQEVFNIFTVINANDDSSTWAWSSEQGTNYIYDGVNNGDDYLVSIGIRLKAGQSYKVIVSARAYSSSYTERFEVLVGKEASVAGLNIVAMSPVDVTSEQFEEFENEFTVSEDGVYHVAIHAISDADMWRLLVNRLAIEKGLEPNAPAAPVLAAEAGAEGALTAAITVTAPTTSVDGNELPASNLSRIDVLRDDEVIASLSATPGETVFYTDETVTAGNHIYQAIPYDANGEAGQKSEKVTIYVGEDVLGDVQDFKATQVTATTITFTWSEVSGLNGGYVNAANVQYDVVGLVIETDPFWGMQYLAEGETLATVTGATTATVNWPVDEGELDYAYFGVKATNAVGSTDPTGDGSWTYVTVGAPEPLPIVEGFASQSLHYMWDSNGGLGVTNYNSDGDNFALKLYASEAGPVAFYLEKVDLKSVENPTLLFDVASGNVSQVFGFGGADGEVDILDGAAVTPEYTTVKVPLSSIVGERYSTVGIIANFANPSIEGYTDTLVIDNIRIIDLPQYDLAVEVNAPKSIKTGETAAINVVVKNLGENAANGYTVKVTANGEELFNETVNSSLAYFKEETFAVDYPTTIFDEPGDVAIEAEVIYELDLNEDNNVAETNLAVKTPTAAPVTNLVAQQVEKTKQVNLSWVAPELTVSSEEVTVDFEDGTLGGWTSIDSDGDGNQWFTHINTGSGNSDNYRTHSGDGVVYSESYGSAGALTPDNWLVSPEAVLDGTFSFWAVGQDPNWADEHFAVFVSTTSATDLSTFVQVSPEYVATGEYQQYSVDLSDYAGQAGWIAIRHYNVTDMFVLVIDDITYLQGSGLKEIASYNVYVDEEKNSAVTETSAQVEVTGYQTYKFSVTAVYTDGVESVPVSVECEVKMPTAIEQLIATGKPVNVYTVDGKLVRQNVTTVEGLKAGLYIVDGKKAVVK